LQFKTPYFSGMIRVLVVLSSCSWLAFPALQGTVLSRAAGTWDITAMIGPRDSVVARYEMIATSTRDGWSAHLPNRDPLPVRVVEVGGDSVVFEIGPFSSILRAGMTVTTRTAAHYRDDSMTGRIVARYSTGDSLIEKLVGTRHPSSDPSRPRRSG
jgi:hypothetical protein